MSATPYRPRTALATHAVDNQPPPLVDYNAYSSDVALIDAVGREGGDWGRSRLEAYGAIAGGELVEIGFDANENPPALRTFDRYGQRIDEVDFHPAYHRSMQLAKAHGLHGLTWTAGRDGAQVVRSALFYLHNQMEAGTMCPITMTHACVPALRHAPALAERWLPGILADAYDPACRPIADKTGLTIGMGMTEKQGGSDVRANTTRAVPAGDGMHLLTGHKWFFSAPMCDAFLVLAREADDGLSCFLLPRWRADDSRNAIDIQRLKDKLGDRSNASSEVEFREAEAWRVGEPGRGVPTIIDMVSQTRLDCMLGSAGLMRQAVVQAIHHCRHREAFGARLSEQPLMQHVLADMALESEAAMALSMRLARAFESDDDSSRLLARIATPVGKYFVCKTAPPLVNEAQECLGGAGYVEESILPRLFRQSPLNSIWEGSGNVQCLDMLRAMSRSPDTLDALEAELAGAAGAHPAYDAHCAHLRTLLRDRAEEPMQARRVAEAVARALQARILLTGAAPWVGEAFCAARLGGDHGIAYGTIGAPLDVAALIERAAVHHSPA
ncbi:isovaleryl-CoA dehydrogenase [Salinisphaera orenii]|uniref:Acyl-CoA dehydrogenase n=1 Tax=Salinisphaera orenii YIM 95161 TaxID=1051139 RepID=A0A423Q0F7_9GAMM|nr:isovaleryl-CoA dehydrogenase [Salinisphaera halophila]ROO31722.1 acyl-CoA dehydrogenase [Salinisphaera halophila YIM 95161]